jgi:phosphate:Na+ symporter
MNYDDTEILMRALAGLGLFFFGIKMITRNLSVIAGDQFRRGLQRASRRALVAAPFGAAVGFVTQSGRTTALLMASFAQAGLIGVRQALPIVLWSNFGSTLVIFSAVIPIYLVALLLIALAGICIAFERPKPFLNSASAAFGLALMLFGLEMMSSAAPVLTTLHGFNAVLAFIKLSPVFAFLTGVILALAAQSNIAVMLIAVAMAARGVFDFDQTLMLIYGTRAGTSLITYITGAHFRGEAQQLVLAQVLYNLFGVVVFVGLYVGEHMAVGHGVLLETVTGGLSSSPGTRAALVAVIFNTVTPLLLTALMPGLLMLCERLAPPRSEDELARPLYIRDEMSETPVAALLLAEQEQLRLLRRLPAYFAWIRDGQAAGDGPSPETYHSAFSKVGQAISRAQGALMAKAMTYEDTEWLVDQQKRQELLGAIDATCFELCEATKDVAADVQPLRDTLVEALDAMVLTAISGMAEKDRDELGLLDTMTRNRGPAMERARQKYLALSDRLPPAERSRILEITSLFERCAWSLNRFGELLRGSPAMEA